MKRSAGPTGGSFRHRSVWPRFRDAGFGIYQAYREEPNLRFHLFATSCAALLAYAAGLAGWEVAYLSVTIALVLTAELVNTAVERTVDLAAAGRRHPLAATAKEVAAGAVLLTAGHAGFAGAYLFLYQHSLSQALQALAQRPVLLLLPVAMGLLGLFGGRPDRS